MNAIDYIVFIITHGRPSEVITVTTLKKQGYTGNYYLVIDDTDCKADDYYKKYPDKVVMFNKNEIAKTTDHGDNFWNLRTTTHARNACFDIAIKLGYKYFLVLDDDYTSFDYRLYLNCAIRKKIDSLDNIFSSIFQYYINSPAQSICMSQGGDFIGGLDNGKRLYRFSLRKAMNSWFCSIDRRFTFISRLNEDVNTYMTLGARGMLFLTIPFCSLDQKQTQKTKGGMTEAYLDGGTYVKSFYSVMYQPSCIRVNRMHTNNGRLHHSINWDCAVPCIIDEKYKKQ